MTPKEQADRIRSAGKMLDYESEALESLARSWEHCADGNNECAVLALRDAQVWATLYLASRSG